MPIVFLHGVATRDDDSAYATGWERLETFLRRYIAPVISDDPKQLAILPIYWGDLGITFAWDQISRAQSPLLGMGGTAVEPTPLDRMVTIAVLHTMLGTLPVRSSEGGVPSGLLPADPASATTPSATPFRLKDLTSIQLSDLLVAVSQQSSILDVTQQTLFALAADAVAHDPNTFPQLAAQSDTVTEMILLQRFIAAHYQQELQQHMGIVGMGIPIWMQDIGDRLGEALQRGADLPGFVAARTLVEVRKWLNNFITLFIGDVFSYIAGRGTANDAGTIPTRVLGELVRAQAARQRSDEPLILISHSMGGQIVYDLVTHFLPNMPQYRDLRIDFWCATASQVGLFEEMKLFLASSPRYSKAQGNMVPFPNRHYLGGWWNVWDYNDFISFTARGIIADIDDEPYNSGMFVAAAHSGYLEQPSFYRAFRKKLTEARDVNWNQP